MDSIASYLVCNIMLPCWKLEAYPYTGVYFIKIYKKKQVKIKWHGSYQNSAFVDIYYVGL